MCGWCVHLCMPTWSIMGHWYPAHSALAYSFRTGSVTDTRSTTGGHQALFTYCLHLLHHRGHRSVWPHPAFYLGARI